MAGLTIREVEGMRQIRIDIENETVRARRGALSNMRGDVTMVPRMPRIGDMVRSIFTHEGRVRPHYEGTGSILLQPSRGGYHLIDVAEGERWILEPGVFRASEGATRPGLTREPFWSSLWLGDGILVWETTIEGRGKVAINAPGPVEKVEIADARLKVQGRLVLGRTAGLAFFLAASGAPDAPLALGAIAAARLRRDGQGARLLDALLERTPLPRDPRRRRGRRPGLTACPPHDRGRTAGDRRRGIPRGAAGSHATPDSAGAAPAGDRAPAGQWPRSTSRISALRRGLVR